MKKIRTLAVASGKRNAPPRVAGSRGFTLIETLVALVIAVSAAVLISNAWSGNYMRIRKTTLNNNMAQLLERKMTEIESKYTGKSFGEIKDEEGDFGTDFSNYKWTFKTQPFAMPDLTPLLSQGENKPVDQTLLTVIKKMQEALGKAVLEATVTVSVVVAGKEIKHSVTTYFVDYDSEPNLSVSQ